MNPSIDHAPSFASCLDALGVAMDCRDRRDGSHAGQACELYPDVVDACEEEGGVPSRLLKTEAGDGRQEGTPWRMFAGSLSGRPSRTGSRLMVSRARVRVG